MRHFILKIHQFIRGWYVLICASWNWCLLQHFFITVHSWSCNTNSYKESCKMTFVCICFVSVTSGGFVMFWVFSPKGSGWWFTAEFICFHDFQSISVSAVHACRHLKAQCLNVSVSVSCMSPRLVSVCNSSFWWVRNRLIKLLMDVMLLDVCMLNGELRSGEVFICSEVLLSEAFWLHHLFRTFFQRLSWKLDFQTLSTCEAWVRFCLLVRLKLMNSSRFKWRSASHQSVLRRPPLLPPLFALSWLVERLPLPKVWDVYQIPFFSVKFGSLGGKVKHETGLDSQNHRGSSPQKKGGIAEKIFPELDKKVQISKKQSLFVGNMIKLVLLRSLFLKLHIQPLLNKVEKVFFWRVGAVGVMKGCTLRIK